MIAIRARMPVALQPPMFRFMCSLSLVLPASVECAAPVGPPSNGPSDGRFGPGRSAPATGPARLRARMPRHIAMGEGVAADLAEIGVIGGSGFYSLLEDVREAKIDTPYGPPSDSLFL